MWLTRELLKIELSNRPQAKNNGQPTTDHGQFFPYERPGQALSSKSLPGRSTFAPTVFPPLAQISIRIRDGDGELVHTLRRPAISYLNRRAMRAVRRRMPEATPNAAISARNKLSADARDRVRAGYLLRTFCARRGKFFE
jgi:hypothetical protein